MANPVKRLANALDDENAIVAVLERGDMSLHRCISVQSRSIIVMPVEGASITSMILSRALATTPLPSDMRIDLQESSKMGGRRPRKSTRPSYSTSVTSLSPGQRNSACRALCPHIQPRVRAAIVHLMTARQLPHHITMLHRVAAYRTAVPAARPAAPAGPFLPLRPT